MPTAIPHRGVLMDTCVIFSVMNATTSFSTVCDPWGPLHSPGQLQLPPFLTVPLRVGQDNFNACNPRLHSGVTLTLMLRSSTIQEQHFLGYQIPWSFGLMPANGRSVLIPTCICDFGGEGSGQVILLGSGP